MRRLAALATLALAGSASASAPHDPAKELREALSGRVAGKSERCIQLRQADGPQIIGETMLYRDGARLWRTEAVGGCPSLRGDPIVVIESFGGQLCENDHFRTLIRGGAAAIPGPVCRFGSFTPYAKPKS